MTRLPRCCQGACGLWMIVGGVSWTGIHFAGAVAGGRGGGGEKGEKKTIPTTTSLVLIRTVSLQKKAVNLLIKNVVDSTEKASAQKPKT